MSSNITRNVSLKRSNNNKKVNGNKSKNNAGNMIPKNNANNNYGNKSKNNAGNNNANNNANNNNANNNNANNNNANNNAGNMIPNNNSNNNAGNNNAGMNSNANNNVGNKSNMSNNKYMDYTKKFVRKMFELTTHIKLFHWKTDSYASHKATDGLFGTLNEIIDKYVETLLGKTGYKLKMVDYSNIPVQNLENNEELEKYIKEIIEFLLEIHTHLNLEKDVDLLNIRDEMIGDLNQFLYLLRLK